MDEHDEIAGPLAGLRVVDCSVHIAGSLAAMLFADLGADVIKIEPPGGEPSRFRQGIDTPVSSGFVASNRGKRSVILDLKRAEAREVLHKLVCVSDVFVTNYRSIKRTGLGIDHPTLTSLNPRLVYASITGQGEDGRVRDTPAFDTVAQGRAGVLGVIMKDEDFDKPMQTAMYVPDTATGIYTTVAVLAALQSRERSGQGQLIETSLLHSGMFFLNINYTRYFDQVANGETPLPRGLQTGGLGFRTSDGRPFVLHVPPSPITRVAALFAAAGRPELIEDPRFSTPDAWSRHGEDADQILRPIFATKTLTEWAETFAQFDVAFAPVNSLSDAAEDPVVQIADVFTTIVNGDEVRMKVVKPPFRLSATPAQARSTPLPGADTQSVLQELGYPKCTVRDMADRGIVSVSHGTDFRAFES